MDVSAREKRQEVRLGERLPLSLDKVHPLVLQWGRPVGVRHQVARKVLADDQLLAKTTQANKGEPKSHVMYVNNLQCLLLILT